MERTVPSYAIGRGNDPTCGEADALFPDAGLPEFEALNLALD
jgi:hypothetical protein